MNSNELLKSALLCYALAATIAVIVALLSLILSGSHAFGAQLNLTWQDNSNNETGFKVERGATSTGPFTQVHAVGPNIRTWSDFELLQAETKCYRVRAYNDAGDSGYTNIACGTTAAMLTVTKMGTGAGNVESNPPGIMCGTQCSGLVPGQTEVILTSAANQSSTFMGWQGACTGIEKCVLKMDGPKAVTAVFDAVKPPIDPSTFYVVGECQSTEVQTNCAITIKPPLVPVPPPASTRAITPPTDPS